MVGSDAVTFALIGSEYMEHGHRWLLAAAVAAAVVLTGCGRAAVAPASLDLCTAVTKHPEGARAYVEYHFKITNRSSRAISAVRINFESPGNLQIGVPFSPERPSQTADYVHAIVPHASVTWMLRTSGLPRTPSPLKSTTLPCSVIAVRYADAHTWSIARGIAAPGE